MRPTETLSAPLELVLGRGGVGRSTVARTLTATARAEGLDTRWAELAPPTGLSMRATNNRARGRIGRRDDTPIHIGPEEAPEDADQLERAMPSASPTR